MASTCIEKGTVLPQVTPYGFFDAIIAVRVLHGPGLGPWDGAGPARSPWAGPGFYDILRAGPGRVRAGCGPETCRPEPGPGWLVSNSFAGCGPGLGLTFPGLGRAGPTVKVTLVLT